jgi:hypothetical protein
LCSRWTERRVCSGSSCFAPRWPFQLRLVRFLRLNLCVSHNHGWRVRSYCNENDLRWPRGTTLGLRCRGSSEPALPRLGHSRDGDRHAKMDLHDWHNAFSRDVRCGRPGRRAARRLPSDCRPNERGTGPVHLRGTELLLVRLRLARAGILLVRLCDAPRPRMGWWGGLAWLAPRGSSRRTHWQR